MIVGFRDRETERIWRGTFSRALPHDIQSTALRKLRMLNNAKVLQDLAAPPNNQLEALKGDRSEQHSIRIDFRKRLGEKVFSVDRRLADDIKLRLEEPNDIA